MSNNIPNNIEAKNETKNKTVHDYSIKIIIIGDSFVGKSNLLAQFTEKKFHPSHDITIGVEFGSKIIKYHDKLYKLQIWDTAGQEAFRSITQSFYRGSLGGLVVFDITNRESFESVKKWINDLDKFTGDPNVSSILVGNKLDLEKNRVITFDEGKKIGSYYNMPYIETSTKNGTNIDTVFTTLLDMISKRIDSGEINNNPDNKIKLDQKSLESTSSSNNTNNDNQSGYVKSITGCSC